MMSWVTLDKARVADGGELILYHRSGEFMIRVDGLELMSSRAHGSEEALAVLVCSHLSQNRGPCVLIGGLGMGYTLRAALDTLPNDALVTVAELVAAVVEWNRGPLGRLAGYPLQDPRVTVEVTDVGRLLRTTNLRFHAILLDVDNGPAALTSQANQFLYSTGGLVTAREALLPGGMLGVWSAAPDTAFEERLRRAGFAVGRHDVPARGLAGDPAHTIYVARASGTGPVRPAR